MSDVPGPVHARLNREAHEALEEATRLCARADLLRADVARLLAVSMTSGGHTRGPGELTDRALAVEELVDLVCEAAGLLGQATWFWAQTMDHEPSGDRAGGALALSPLPLVMVPRPWPARDHHKM